MIFYIILNYPIFVLDEFTEIIDSESITITSYPSMKYAERSTHKVPIDKVDADLEIVFPISREFKSIYLSGAYLSISSVEFIKDSTCLEIHGCEIINSIKWCPDEWRNVQVIDVQRVLLRTLQYHRLKNKHTDQVCFKIHGIKRTTSESPVQLILKYYNVINGNPLHCLNKLLYYSFI